jgi:DNA polymerase-3 subunit gamma/tau
MASQKFDEIVFQDHIATTIRNGIKQGRISHAYLFSGPRGVGKTTTARIVARALNCAEGPTENPCGVCEHCREIREGSSFDVIEIDGASNRGIENIRELRENVNFAPVKARYKVYIIDEVHMLTKEAFNALLKTLEEPPPHVVFIFATTEIHQVPETILSRCQKYFFKKIPPDAIAAHLGAIAEREGFDIDGAALYPIARAADGSMRDAQSLLDQVLAFSDGRIRAESALAILGVVPVESYLSLLGHIASADPAAVIAEINRVASMGAALPRYIAGFIDMVCTVRLMKNGIDMKEISGFSDAEAASIRECAGLFVDSELSAFFKIAAELQGKLRIASNERIYIEMAMLDMIAVRNAPSIASIISRLEGEVSEQAAPRRKAPPAAAVKEKKNDFAPDVNPAPAPGPVPPAPAETEPRRLPSIGKRTRAGSGLNFWPRCATASPYST